MLEVLVIGNKSVAQLTRTTDFFFTLFVPALPAMSDEQR